MYATFRSTLFALAAVLCASQLSGCGLISKAVEQQQEEAVSLFETDPISYRTDIVIENFSGDTSSIRFAMEKNSQLVQMHAQKPDGLVGLIRRARADEAAAVRLLHSLGYFDGRARIEVSEPEAEGKDARVRLMLVPGTRYSVGSANVEYHNEPVQLPDFEGRAPAELPHGLAGLVGKPAEADAVLAAVNALPPVLQQAGYPEAAVVSSRYTLDKAKKLLNAEVTVDTGGAAVMGDIRIVGTDSVDPDYLRKLVTWKNGEPWDERRIMAFREELQKLGLFRAVDVKAAPMADGTESGHDGVTELPAVAYLKDSSFKTIGGSARYSSEDGIGVQAEWQHRNVFGAGEKLTVKAPFAQDKRGLQADFEKPCFGRKDQKLLAGSSFLKEETDAYDSTALNGYVGLERRLSSDWWANVKLFAEKGTVTRESKEDYHYGSLIFGLRRDTRDSLLDPAKGTHIQWTAAPVSGYYGGNFTGFSAGMDMTGYYSPFDSDFLVLAGRMAFGAFVGADLANIPPTLRYYAGGGGSVRGYAYQAIGPKDRYGDPRGGRSYQEINLEARFRVAKDIGIVPFIDGGMIYDEEYPQFFDDLQWSAGLGLRYYTPIGPIRFDVAIPLDKKEGDKGYQIYISIGQAF